MVTAAYGHIQYQKHIWCFGGSIYLCSSKLLLPVGNGPEDPLHHGEVLAVIVRLEQRDAEEQLEHDAAHRPHVARLRPAQLCNTGRRRVTTIYKTYQQQRIFSQ